MLSTDRNSFFFGVGAIVVTLGVGMCSTNGRFDDLNGRIDALNADVDQRIDALNADVDQRIDALNADVNRRFDGVDQRIDEVGADIRGLRADVNGIDERLRAVAVAFGRVDPAASHHRACRAAAGVARRVAGPRQRAARFR